ncbi:hypothetical protein CSQ94_04905 [Janthinobacterium sp. BJB312]|nr:hypothetical protein CSQ94_04905 [Janthinobacterium sp. BJB312]
MALQIAKQFMNDNQLDELSRQVLKALVADDGAAAKSHLAAGRPIYYYEDPDHPLIRKWQMDAASLFTSVLEGLLLS